MRQRKYLGNLPWAFAAALLFIAGCSHAIFPQNGGGNGGNTVPMILAFHDTPPSGITLTSFQVTVTGAVLQPGNVSLLSAPGQTIELTQLQANSAILSTTQVALSSYTSLTITYANPKYTFLNDSGITETVNGQACAAGASCVVTPTISGASTITLPSTAPFPVVTTTGQTTLLQVDVNLNNIIQSDFSVNFANSGAATVVQGSTAGSALGNLAVNGVITSVGTNQFNLAASTGQSLTVAVGTSTAYEFQRANCTANDFTCLATGQIVDVDLNVLTGGTFQASEVDFDDATNTQQVSGTIVSFNATPPTSFQMVMHNTVPPISGFSVGTPVTVTLGNAVTFVINNGSLPLPAGVTFASNSDLLVGQEVEARVSGTFTAGPPPSFTTDRIALEPTQLNAAVSSISSQAQPLPLFVLKPLPPMFSQAPINSVTQIQVLISPTTQFEGPSLTSLSSLQVGNVVSVGGFLFNTTSTTGSPSIVANAVIAPVPGT
ncbi:MAG TPA: DUF5666 domain-containing protein [Candidatus Limnocylindrales bacterium]|nr:DUF5666 domain-containing protein [Candidatus Limnocylindrales bacterium]